MFDSILIRPGELQSSAVDFGEIAEAMVFYGRVHLFLDDVHLRSLVAQVGVGGLLTLVDSGMIDVTVLRDGLATHEAHKYGRKSYDFISFEPFHQDKSERSDFEIVTEAFITASDRLATARRAAHRFLRVCKVASINEGTPHPNGIPELSREDLRDQAYVTDALTAAISVLAPSYRLPTDFKFEVEPREGSYQVGTNLELDALNAAHRAAFPSEDSKLSIASLLDTIHTARGDLFLASTRSAELATSNLSSAVISAALRHSVKRMLPAAQFGQLTLFQGEHFEGRTVREVINSGERNLKELLELVETASKFRGWLQDSPPDARLIKEYSRALVADTWADRLPVKAVRYIVFTAAAVVVEALAPMGGMGVAISHLLGLGDTFLVDKLLKGWKPNQFVDHDLAGFLGGNRRTESH